MAKKMTTRRSAKTGDRNTGKVRYRATSASRSISPRRFITVDGEYVKTQAREAFETFFAPLSGAIEAAKAAGGPPIPEKVGNDR